MNVLVTYDVSTTTPAGRRRLRRVARVCEDYGRRVQFSVFECVLGSKELVLLRNRLLDEIDLEEDSIRLYHLRDDLKQGVECYGQNRSFDFQTPLII